ncbi:hypothetical protein PYCC9005_001740 [Savitreella phatthalungensis]
MPGAIVAAAVLWLLYRISQLWIAPLNIVLRSLAIELPGAPRVTVDALSHDSVSLHWAPPDGHVKKHIIRMDSQEVGISVRGETSVTISGLAPDFLYSIQVVAVNTLGFQIASQVVYVRTRRAQEAPTRAVLVTSAQAPQQQQAIQRPIRRHLSSENVISKEDAATIAALTIKMDCLRTEAAEVDAQIAQLAKNHAQEEADVLARLEDIRSRKREEDDARSAKDHTHKQLDQQKRELEMRRNQSMKSLKAERDDYQRQCTDLASFASSIRNSIETVEHLEESRSELRSEAAVALRDAERMSAMALEELSEVESEIRYLLQRKVESEAELTRLQSQSRVPSPSPQEKSENQQADAAWREREEALVRQYDEIHKRLIVIQTGALPVRRWREPERPPSFNPDAVPFQPDPYALPRPPNDNYNEAFATGSGLGNVYSGAPGFFPSGQYMARKPSPFGAMRDSPMSSQSGSNPSSPAIHHNAIASIFSNPAIGANPGPEHQRVSSSSLVSSLNGIPLSPEPATGDRSSSSRWFWPVGKKKDASSPAIGHDPLALDRKSTRSLPKADVAPIGTRRVRSGSVTASAPMSDPTKPAHDGSVGWDPVRGGNSVWSAGGATSFDPFATDVYHDAPEEQPQGALYKSTSSSSSLLKIPATIGSLPSSIHSNTSTSTTGKSSRKDAKRFTSFVGRVFGNHAGNESPIGSN